MLSSAASKSHAGAYLHSWRGDQSSHRAGKGVIPASIQRPSIAGLLQAPIQLTPAAHILRQPTTGLQATTTTPSVSKPLHGAAGKPLHTQTPPCITGPGVITVSSGKPLLQASGNPHHGKPHHAPSTTLHALGQPLHALHHPRNATVKTTHVLGKPRHPQGTNILQDAGQSLQASTKPPLVGSVVMFGTIPARPCVSDHQCAHPPHVAHVFPCSTHMADILPAQSTSRMPTTLPHLAQSIPACAGHAPDFDGDAAIIDVFLATLAEPAMEGISTAEVSALAAPITCSIFSSEPLSSCRTRSYGISNHEKAFSLLSAAYPARHSSAINHAHIAVEAKGSPAIFDGVQRHLAEEDPTVYKVAGSFNKATKEDVAAFFPPKEDDAALPAAKHPYSPAITHVRMNHQKGNVQYYAAVNGAFINGAFIIVTPVNNTYPHRFSPSPRHCNPLSSTLTIAAQAAAAIHGVTPVIAAPLVDGAHAPLALIAADANPVATAMNVFSSTFMYDPHATIVSLASILKGLQPTPNVCFFPSSLTIYDPGGRVCKSSSLDSKLLTHHSISVALNMALVFIPQMASTSTLTLNYDTILSFRLQGRISDIQTYESITSKLMNLPVEVTLQRTNGISISSSFSTDSTSTLADCFQAYLNQHPHHVRYAQA